MERSRHTKETAGARARGVLPCILGHSTLAVLQWDRLFSAQASAAEAHELAAQAKNVPELRDAPLFCFETAVRCLYWSTLTYRYSEVSAVNEGPPLSWQAALRVFSNVM